MKLEGRKSYIVCLVIIALAACQYFFKLEIPKEVWLGLFGLLGIALRSAVGGKAALLLALLLPLRELRADETTFAGRLSVSTTWAHKKTSGGSTLSETVPQLFSWTHADGTNTLQMNAFVGISGTLAAGASNLVSLGSCRNGFGDTVAFSRVGVMSLVSAATNTVSLRLGGAAADAFSAWCGSAADTVTVPPGGMAMLVAPSTNGYAVGTATNLLVVNLGATNALYDLFIGGVSQ